MKTAAAVLLTSLTFGLLFSGTWAHAEGPSPKKVVTSSTLVHNSDADTMRLQGEQRYRANCARCHAAPQKFPPRMMATVLRHMRVRATITDEDMRLVLFYMSQ
jgi:mono/diheme cytochrome c family protein